MNEYLYWYKCAPVLVHKWRGENDQVTSLSTSMIAKFNLLNILAISVKMYEKQFNFIVEYQI